MYDAELVQLPMDRIASSACPAERITVAAATLQEREEYNSDGKPKMVAAIRIASLMSDRRQNWMKCLNWPLESVKVEPLPNSANAGSVMSTSQP